MRRRALREQALEQHLTRVADEYIARVNETDLTWCVLAGCTTTAETYAVDVDATTGPVVLIRESDRARFAAHVSVTVEPIPGLGEPA